MERDNHFQVSCKANESRKAIKLFKPITPYHTTGYFALRGGTHTHTHTCTHTHTDKHTHTDFLDKFQEISMRQPVVRPASLV